MGYFLKNERKLLAIRKDKIRMGLLMLCSAIGVYLCSQYNDCVLMVNHEFGGNIFYFLIGSICGIVLVYILARMLEDIKWHFIIDLSTGMILILGFQMQFITLICRYIHICGGRDFDCFCNSNVDFYSNYKISRKILPIFDGKI